MPELPSAQLVALIPALPLLGFLYHAFLGKRMGKTAGAWIGVGVVFAAFAVSLVVFKDLLGLQGEEKRALASLVPFAQKQPWIHIGNFQVDFGALVDPLSVLMCLIVTGVGGLIHLYATGYMAHDKDHSRFFCYFNLFIFFMLVLVLGENLLLTFVGWEGVGLCSYLLISFWYEDMENSKAGNKAFIVNRVGDLGFALGVMLVFATFGTLAFYEPDGGGFLEKAKAGLEGGVATTIALLLFVGAAGKSAQFPLHVWLPDAMAGPTPVSALIHAATMVTAGVVMITRVSPIVVQSPLAMTVIACVGIFTALFAATIALTQNDIKKVLAYSTVSQLGYMFVGCGVGAFSAGMFHVTTHAFFKALLFLGSGSVIHALSGEQDMRKMGGLRQKIPITHVTMFLGWLAICGIFPFAGFWSKDEILGYASGFGGLGMAIYVVGVGTAALTAFYMSRLMWKTFWSNQRFNEAELGAHGHGDHEGRAPGVHESPPSMWVPLAVLAVLSVAGGWIGTPFANWFEHFLEPSVGKFEAHHGLPIVLGMAVGLAAGLAGILYARKLYGAKRDTAELMTAEQRAGSQLYQGSIKLWGVDSFLYDYAVVRGGKLAQFCWQGIDRIAIDGTINFLGGFAAFLSEGFRRLQTGYIRAYALTMMIGVVAVVLSLLMGNLSR